MTAVPFPTSPIPWSVKPRLVDYGGDLTPPLGGPVQRVVRLGSRWAVDVSFPSISGRWAKAMIAARIKARAGGSTLIMSWPQPTERGGFGAPVVSGGGQAGLSLAVSGLTRGLIEAGTFFSLTVSGRNYLYMVTDTIMVGPAGTATLQTAPMLRATPDDQAAINFLNPQIEGFVAGATEDWSLDMLLKTSLFSFTIAEVQ